MHHAHLIFSDSFSLEDAEILALKTLKQVNGHQMSHYVVVNNVLTYSLTLTLAQPPKL